MLNGEVPISGTVLTAKSKPAREPKRRRNRKKKGDVKLADVARLAGVSPATVSRALNQADKVSPVTLKRIRKTITTLNWVPHAGARALASHSSRLIGVIVATLGNPNVAIGLQAIERRLAEAGYSLLIACDDLDPKKQLAHARIMLERGADALILHGEGHKRDIWEFLSSQDVPVIVNHSFSTAPGCLSVGYDAYAEFSRLTSHLLDLGHRSFGLMMLTSPTLERKGDTRPMARIRTKYKGVVDTLAKHDIVIRDEHRTNTFFSLNAGRRCFRKIMSSASPPTALICMNDQMAIGAIIESREMGLSVPADVSIVGCDDIELAGLTEPPLTTIRPPDEAMGTMTAESVLECIARTRSCEGWRELAAEIVIRESTAPPRHSS